MNKKIILCIAALIISLIAMSVFVNADLGSISEVRVNNANKFCEKLQGHGLVCWGIERTIIKLERQQDKLGRGQKTLERAKSRASIVLGKQISRLSTIRTNFLAKKAEKGLVEASALEVLDPLLLDLGTYKTDIENSVDNDAFNTDVDNAIDKLEEIKVNLVELRSTVITNRLNRIEEKYDFEAQQAAIDALSAAGEDVTELQRLLDAMKYDLEQARDAIEDGDLPKSREWKRTLRQDHKAYKKALKAMIQPGDD